VEMAGKAHVLPVTPAPALDVPQQLKFMAEYTPAFIAEATATASGQTKEQLADFMKGPVTNVRRALTDLDEASKKSLRADSAGVSVADLQGLITSFEVNILTPAKRGTLDNGSVARQNQMTYQQSAQVCCRAVGSDQGNSQVLPLSTGFPCKVLFLSTKPEVPWFRLGSFLC
jgi:hypothetical protein